jgi:predicted AlkP superfamily phosphohydrolase/phosphomutase
MSNKKAVVFGIDGCPEELLRKWVIEENRFPNFRRIYDNGIFSSINSTIPHVTVPAWMSLLTGKSPGRLNVFSFFERNKDSYKSEIADLGWKKWRPVWDVLNSNKKRPILFNVPSTVPPKSDFDGIMISGPIMNDDPDNLAYPESWNKKLIESNFKIDYNVSIHHDPPGAAKKIIKQTREKVKLAQELFQDENWDFFMFAFFYCDAFLHFFWKYLDKNHPEYEDNPEYANYVIEFYSLIDEHLGFYLDRLPDDTNLYIVSDHGFGPSTYHLDINNWFWSNGFMTLKNADKTRINLESIQSKPIYRMARNTYKAVESFKPLRKLRNMMFDNISRQERSYKDVDWDSTKLYSIGSSYIYVNLKGREPNGIVNPGQEYDELLQEVSEKLLQLKDPDDNQPAIDKVIKGSELYPDTDSSKLPDLFIIGRDESYYSIFAQEAAPKNELFYKHENQLSGYHRINTFFGAYGPDIKKTSELENRRIYDIIPTIYHNMDVPIPSDIDGNVMKEIFSESSDSFKREINKVDPDAIEIDEESAKEDEIVKKRLKNLGYI